MAFSLFTLWEKFIGEVNTHQGGHVKPHRQFPNWVNDISMELFMEDYAVWQKSQIISDRIARFLVSKPVKVIPGPATYDIIPLPVGYEYFSDCRFYHKGDLACVEVECATEAEKVTYKTAGLTEQKINLIDNMRWAAAAKHKIKGAKIDRPYITQFDGGFKLIPNAKGINFVVIDWFRLPKVGTFVYTVGSDDQIIYDSTNSQELEWSATVINDFVKRLSMKYGKFVREQFIYQTSAAEKETTA